MLPLAILAGGYASRLGSLTVETPKCLIEINGRPFVDWQLDLLIDNGYSDFVFCVSYMSEAVIKHLSSRAKKGIHIEYSFDGPEQLGTGGAIQKALPFLGDAFGVIYGDSYLPTNFIPIEQEFLNSKVIGLMTIFQNDNQFESSNVEFVDGKLINYEKGTNSRNMSHIDYGLTFFKGSAFSPWKDRPSFDLSEVCHQLAKKEQLVGFEVFERFYEIGSVRGIEEFSQYLKKESDEF